VRDGTERHQTSEWGKRKRRDRGRAADASRHKAPPLGANPRGAGRRCFGISKFLKPDSGLFRTRDRFQKFCADLPKRRRSTPLSGRALCRLAAVARPLARLPFLGVSIFHFLTFRVLSFCVDSQSGNVVMQDVSTLTLTSNDMSHGNYGLKMYGNSTAHLRHNSLMHHVQAHILVSDHAELRARSHASLSLFVSISIRLLPCVSGHGHVQLGAGVGGAWHCTHTLAHTRLHQLLLLIRPPTCMPVISASSCCNQLTHTSVKNK
jgi:hypothetical protein